MYFVNLKTNMSSQSSPEIRHEEMPTGLQWSDLLADPLTINREKFSALESLAFDYVHFIDDTMQHGIEEKGDEAYSEEEPVVYKRTRGHDLLQHNALSFSMNREYNEENTDFIRFEIEMNDSVGTKTLGVFFTTEHMPSLTEDSDDGEEIMHNFQLYFGTSEYDSSLISIDSAATEAPEEREIELLRNTLEHLKQSLESDYELA